MLPGENVKDVVQIKDDPRFRRFMVSAPISRDIASRELGRGETLGMSAFHRKPNL